MGLEFNYLNMKEVWPHWEILRWSRSGGGIQLKEQWIREGFSSYYVVDKGQKLTYEKNILRCHTLRCLLPCEFRMQDGKEYHKDLSCTHLALDISVDEDVLKYQNGQTHYKACSKCTRHQSSNVSCVYIAKEGESYHTDLSCSGLKRTVKQVDLSTLKGMKPCQRCGKQGDT